MLRTLQPWLAPKPSAPAGGHGKRAPIASVATDRGQVPAIGGRPMEVPDL